MPGRERASDIYITRINITLHSDVALVTLTLSRAWHPEKHQAGDQ